MSQETKQRAVWWVAITSGLALFYVISGWPITYTMCYFQRHTNNAFTSAVSEAIGLVYAPHGWVMKSNQWYYRYLGSAAELAMPGFKMPTWDEWQLEQAKAEEQR